MEIEKTRETSWKIQLKHKDENVEITSVEISGEVRIIKLALLNRDKSIRVEMNKEEFYNFLSLISAFKDVVIGEESLVLNDQLAIIEENPTQIQEKSNSHSFTLISIAPLLHNFLSLKDRKTTEFSFF